MVLWLAEAVSVYNPDIRSYNYPYCVTIAYQTWSCMGPISYFWTLSKTYARLVQYHKGICSERL